MIWKSYHVHICTFWLTPFKISIMLVSFGWSGLTCLGLWMAFLILDFGKVRALSSSRPSIYMVYFGLCIYLGFAIWLIVTDVRLCDPFGLTGNSNIFMLFTTRSLEYTCSLRYKLWLVPVRRKPCDDESLLLFTIFDESIFSTCFAVDFGRAISSAFGSSSSISLATGCSVEIF